MNNEKDFFLSLKEKNKGKKVTFDALMSNIKESLEKEGIPLQTLDAGGHNIGLKKTTEYYIKTIDTESRNVVDYHLQKVFGQIFTRENPLKLILYGQDIDVFFVAPLTKFSNTDNTKTFVTPDVGNAGPMKHLTAMEKTILKKMESIGVTDCFPWNYTTEDDGKMIKFFDPMMEFTAGIPLDTIITRRVCTPEGRQAFIDYFSTINPNDFDIITCLNKHLQYFRESYAIINPDTPNIFPGNIMSCIRYATGAPDEMLIKIPEGGMSMEVLMAALEDGGLSESRLSSNSSAGSNVTQMSNSDAEERKRLLSSNSRTNASSPRQPD